MAGPWIGLVVQVTIRLTDDTDASFEEWNAVITTLRTSVLNFLLNFEGPNLHEKVFFNPDLVLILFLLLLFYSESHDVNERGHFTMTHTTRGDRCTGDQWPDRHLRWRPWCWAEWDASAGVSGLNSRLTETRGVNSKNWKMFLQQKQVGGTGLVSQVFHREKSSDTRKRVDEMFNKQRAGKQRMMLRRNVKKLWAQRRTGGWTRAGASNGGKRLHRRPPRTVKE